MAAGALVQNATIHLSGPDAVLYNNTSSNAVLNNDPSQTGDHWPRTSPSPARMTAAVFGPFDNLGTITITAGSCRRHRNSAVDVGPTDGTHLGNLGPRTHVDLPSTASGRTDGTITATQAGGREPRRPVDQPRHHHGEWRLLVTLGDASSAVSGPSDIWKNSGVLSITATAGATLNLGDYFTTDEFESGFQDHGVNLDLSQFETVNLIGTLDNSPADNPITGGILTLNASTGPLYLAGGEIDGGTITGTAPVVDEPLVT